MAKLTVKTIESLVKAGIPGLTSDGDGLYLKITRTGMGSWIYRYKISGKTRDMGLGQYAHVSLAMARDRAGEARKLVRAKIDPLAARDAEKERLTKQVERELAEQAAAQARALSFKKVCEDYIASHRAGWRNAKHAQQWENTLSTYAFPVIGTLPTGEITIDHMLKILQPIWITKPETASRVRNRIELVMDAAKALGLREGENPARWKGHLDKLLPAKSKVRKVVHHPALPWRELPAFMAGLTTHDELSYQAMRMTILTACRTSEVLCARWSEFDFETQTWIIPASRMKADREHRVPLSPAVLKLLNGLPRIERSPFLFPGARKGKPISNMAMLMALRRLERSDITMHGFRSTFRDWAAENTLFPREICEMSLAHTVTDDSEGAYWRSDILAKRRALMCAWADYCNNGQSTNPALNIAALLGAHNQTNAWLL